MRTALLLLALLGLSACGSHAARSPEAVARAWSAALDRNDNRAAASLFANGAQVVQDQSLVLPSHNDALRRNRELPCGCTIESVTTQGANEVLVIFELTERPRTHVRWTGSPGGSSVPRVARRDRALAPGATTDGGDHLALHSERSGRSEPEIP